MKSGFGAGKQEQSQEEGGIIQIRPTNIGNEGNLKFKRNIYLPKNLLESNKDIFLEKGDVLFNNTNSQELVGKTSFFDEEGSFMFSNHITRIRVDESKIKPYFLVLIFNAFHRKKIFYSICTNWNNQSGIGAELLRSLKIPIPPLEKQEEIVALFQNAYQQKQEKEAEAKRLLESIDAYLLEKLGIELPTKKESEKIFFTSLKEIQGKRFDPFYHKTEFEELEKALENGMYKIAKLGSFLSQISYGASVKNEYVKDASKGIPFLRISDLKRNEINVKKMVYLSKDMESKLGNCFVYENDFLISRSGTTGVVAKVDSSVEGFAYGSFMIKFVLKDNALINKNYLAFYLNTEIMQKLIERDRIGAIQGNITISTIRSFIIPLPPLEVQDEIATHISDLRNRAKELEKEAKAILKSAKKEVENMILGE